MADRFIHIQNFQKQWTDHPHCKILDVRELAEYRQERIDKSIHVPLSDISNNIDHLNKEETYFILCQSGNRATKAAKLLQNNGFTNIQIVEGGISAWKSAGGKVYRDPSKWSLERQVRCTAGLLVLTGVIIGHFLHPFGYYLSAFIGTGLIFSAITNTCGMGLVLTKMPWNR